MARLALAFFGGLLLTAALSGCGFGPAKDRLVPSEWKCKKHLPIKLESDWKYRGEQWEQVAPSEDQPAAKK